jgi:chromosome segregation ATPase
MEQKANIASVVLIIALIASYFFFQNKIETLESQLSTTVTDAVADSGSEVVQSSSYVSSDSSSLQSQLDDLNNQLITTRSELQSVQQKLILSTSKTQVLIDEVAQMKDARPEVQDLKTQLAATEEKLESEGKVAQVSQEKYDSLASALAEQNLKVAVRNTNRIKNLKETTSAASITAAVVPLLSIATLVDYTRNEIKNYCNDVEDIIALENQEFGGAKSIVGDVMDRFEAQCR